MTKTIEIGVTCCVNCPYFGIGTNMSDVCMKLNKSIEGFKISEEIPDWCELPNKSADKLIDQIMEISSTKEGKSVQELALKCTEEVGELAQAVLSYTGASGSMYKKLTEEHIVEELADIILVDLALFARMGMTKEEFKLIIEKKLQKWIEKMNH